MMIAMIIRAKVIGAPALHRCCQGKYTASAGLQLNEEKEKREKKGERAHGWNITHFPFLACRRAQKQFFARASLVICARDDFCHGEVAGVIDASQIPSRRWVIHFYTPLLFYVDNNLTQRYTGQRHKNINRLFFVRVLNEGAFFQLNYPRHLIIFTTLGKQVRNISFHAFHGSNSI